MRSGFAAPIIGPIELVVLLATAVLFLWPMCRICAKAGFPWPLGLLAAVPVANFVLLYVLAFAEWPALRGKGTGALPEI
jgi:hypothetical protein